MNNTTTLVAWYWANRAIIAKTLSSGGLKTKRGTYAPTWPATFEETMLALFHDGALSPTLVRSYIYLPLSDLRQAIGGDEPPVGPTWPVQVVNLKRNRALLEKRRGFVYVGRRFAGFDASPLANPYKVRNGDAATACAKYRNVLQNATARRTGPVWDDLSRLSARITRGEILTLGCWCVACETSVQRSQNGFSVAPDDEAQCHAIDVAKAALWLSAKDF